EGPAAPAAGPSVVGRPFTAGVHSEPGALGAGTRRWPSEPGVHPHQHERPHVEVALARRDEPLLERERRRVARLLEARELLRQLALEPRELLAQRLEPLLRARDVAALVGDAADAARRRGRAPQVARAAELAPEQRADQAGADRDRRLH